MLYWHFRNFQCILCSFFRKKINPTEIISRKFFANPWDTDWGNSIQAGRFFTYTDAARWEIAGSLGFLKQSWKKKWVVIIGGQKIIYRHPVRIFKFFNLNMRILGWDDKWFYAAHKFEQKSKTCCVSFTKIGLRTNGKLFSPIQAFQQIGFEQIIPPQWLLKHFQNDLETIQEMESAF